VPDIYDGEIDDPVKIYSTMDEVIPKLGSVLHNKKSNAIYKILSSNPTKEYYLKELAVMIEKDENPRLPIYEHHIGILVDSGIVKIRIKMHNKHKTKYYRASPVAMIISPQYYEKALNSKTLKNAFDKVFKLGTVGIAGIATWFGSSFANEMLGFSSRIGESTFLKISLFGLKIPSSIESIIFPVIATSIVTSLGLLVFYFSRKKRN